MLKKFRHRKLLCSDRELNDARKQQQSHRQLVLRAAEFIRELSHPREKIILMHLETAALARWRGGRSSAVTSTAVSSDHAYPFC
jgi:hypothetical protein